MIDEEIKLLWQKANGAKPDGVLLHMVRDFTAELLSASKPAPCIHANDPKACYRVRCQLGNKCVYDDMSPRAPAATAQSGEPVAWREEAQRLFDRCKLWPEETGDGFMALLELRNHVGALLENAASAQSGEAVAWMTCDGRIATDETKRTAMANSSKPSFSIPLYAASPAAPAPSAVVLDDALNNRIREIFLANGFTIKEGQTDLKPYVYQAAYALLWATGVIGAASPQPDKP